MRVSSTVRLPDFLIVGSAPCGSTVRYHHLSSHPDVFMSRATELNFFVSSVLNHPGRGIGDNDKPFIRTIDDYRALFEGAVGYKAVGEDSPGYLYYYEHAIPQIRYWLKDPRIIIALRNPVERAFSAYLLRKYENREFLSFENALAAEENRIRSQWSHDWFYRTRGLYYRQVRAYLEQFSRVKVLLFDDLRENPGTVIRSVYEFLDIATSNVPNVPFRNTRLRIPRSRLVNSIFVKKTRLHPLIRKIGVALFTEPGWKAVRNAVRRKLSVPINMKPDTRRALIEFYREDILNLQDLIGRDLSDWVTPAESGCDTSLITSEYKGGH